MRPAAECAEGGVDGPFRGVPILLKDSAMMAGDPLHLGMQVFVMLNIGRRSTTSSSPSSDTRIRRRRAYEHA